MPYGNLEGDAGAVAEPEDVCFVDLQVSKESSDIVRRGLERNGRIAIASTAVPLFLHGDGPAAGSENREHSAERDIDGRPAAVKQDERNAVFATMQFVVHVDAVDRSITTLYRL
jgi:hypothetical protein